MSQSSQLYLEGFVSVNDADWSRKAVLGSGGTGVYGSGNDCGVYAIVGTDENVDENAYGLKALKGHGKGAILTQGDVHLTEGRVGIGTTSPKEKLEVDGAVRIGTRGNTGAAAGTVRWSPTAKKLQVFDGTKWVNLH